MTLAGARFLLPSLLVVACGPSVVPGSDDDSDPEPCAGEVCQAPAVCVADLGCRDCDPRSPRICVDGDVVACAADGTFGGVLEDCGDLGCGGGTCGAGACGAGARTIYVVTSDDELMSFDPAMGAHTFTSIGRLQCPAGPEWAERGGGAASPYSMAVGRHGSAWVLYTSGELFEVSTADASCRPTSFVPGRGGFKLFGMGFVSDPGSTEEQLFIAGGTVEAPGQGNLARLTSDHAAVELRAPLVRGEFQPELTGTGNGELWAYYPGQQGSFVARLDPASAQLVTRAPLPPLAGIPVGWAFAHWGGRFYVFVSDIQVGGSGATQHRVLRVDPATGAVDVVRSGLGFKVVGAGVSTCAPIVVG
jgi:hypothetical protein